MIRKAKLADIPRIAEIAVFARRMAYRNIFHDDAVSFGDLQVISYARALSRLGELDDYYVCDDGILRGYMRVLQQDDLCELRELYVDPPLQGEGVGSSLMGHFLSISHRRPCELWVLEENQRARLFYETYGFRHTGLREPETAGIYKILYRKERR